MIEMIYKGETTEGRDRISLPKNVRQVGEIQKDRKIYIEDYVVTYMKQKIKENKNLGCIMVMMGRKEYTQDTMYLFVDGAFIVDYQSAGANYCFGDKIWGDVYETIKKYFVSSEMVGWMIYDDDLDEDKLIKAQRKNFPAEDILLLTQEAYEEDGRYYLYREGELQELRGFFVYYEKNPAMQEFMVAQPAGSTAEEEKKQRQKDVPIEHYRNRMRERRTAAAQNRPAAFLYAVSSVLILLVILVGIGMVNNYEKLLNMRASLEQMTAELQAAEEPEPEMPQEVPAAAEVEILPAEIEPLQKQEEEPVPSEVKQEEEQAPLETEQEPADKTSAAETKVYYTVEPGETLMGICKEIYGSPEMIEKVCEVNGIEDSDKIQAGQKILLP